MNTNLIATIGNPAWLSQNESRIRNLFPREWLEMTQADALQVGYGLKLLGVDWRSPDEFCQVMVKLQNIGIFERRNGFEIRASQLMSHDGISLSA